MSELFTVYESDKFSGKIEVRDGLTFFHVDASDALTRSDVKKARKIFSDIKESLVEVGCQRLYAYTPKPHFARLLGAGFIHIETIPHNGEVYELIVWELTEEV